MAKRKFDQLFDYVYEYYHNSETELLDLCMTLGFPTEWEDDETKEMIILKSVYSLMGIAVILYAGKTILPDDDEQFIKALKKKDFEFCRALLVDYFYHVFVNVSVKWVDAPTRLSRNFLVPIRNTIGDLIYATLVSLRADEKQLVKLSTPFISFIASNDPLNDIKSGTDYADIYPLLSLMDCKNIRLIYGFDNDYEFKIRLLKTKYINDEKSYLKNVIVTKAKGYGIYENNITDLYSYLEDPSSVTLPFAFEDADIEELHELADADFDLTRLHYQGVDIDALIESFADIEDEIKIVEA